MVRCRYLEHLNIINYAVLLLIVCMSGGIWWALRLVGILDERNVFEWSVLRCSGCRVLICGSNNIGVSCLCVIVGAIVIIRCVLRVVVVFFWWCGGCHPLSHVLELDTQSTAVHSTQPYFASHKAQLESSLTRYLLTYTHLITIMHSW